MCRRSAAHWVHRQLGSRGLFPVPARSLSRPAVPRACDGPGSSFSLRVLFRVPSFVRSRRDTGLLRRPGQPARVLRPSPRHHPRASTSRGGSHSPLRSVRRRSQPLDGLLRAPASRACSIPQPCPGHSLVQGLLSPRSQLASSAMLCPPAVPRASAQVITHLATGAAATSGLFLRAEQRTHRRMVNPPPSRSPLRVLPPPGSPARRRVRLPGRAPLMKLPKPNLRSCAPRRARAR
jgi:hypothetical protein